MIPGRPNQGDNPHRDKRKQPLPALSKFPGHCGNCGEIKTDMKVKYDSTPARSKYYFCMACDFGIDDNPPAIA